MKRTLHYQIGGALLLSFACGWGGYALGVRNAGRNAFPEAGESAVKDSKSSRETRLKAFDPAAVKREIDAEKSQLGRFRMAQENLDRWVAKDPLGALNWLASQPPSYRKQELIRLALQQFAETDGRGAAQWALENLEGAELNNGLIAIANEWALQNGREAAEWFLALPETRERDAAVENMMFVWATNEPKAALSFVDGRADLADFASTLRRASLAGWSKSDPEGAVAASLDISRKQNDPAQFANTIANWATVDLAKSSEWLIRNVEAGTARNVAAAELGVIFAQQSPQEGLGFLDKLNAGEERDAAGNVFAAEWSTVGAEDAAEWAAAQKTIKLSDEAAAEISMNYFAKDPEGFAKWKASLPPGNLKNAADLAEKSTQHE
ncbi:MAG: hypothetical protein RLZZ505_1178 [Verrucomicrobiota bacterium]|jgi:hypothetical protein